MKWIDSEKVREKQEKNIEALVHSLRTGEPLPEEKGLWERIKGIRAYIPKSIKTTITGLLLVSMAVSTFAACTMPPTPRPYTPTPSPSPTYTAKPEESPTFTPTIEPSPTPLECELSVYTIQPGDTATKICEEACLDINVCLEKVAEQVESGNANTLKVGEDIELYFPIGMYPTPTPGMLTPTPSPEVSPSPSPSPTETASPTPTLVTPSPSPVPQIYASCYPDKSAPLEDLVILRGAEHLFDPSCEVSGGVGQITALWDINRDGTPESNQIDPVPLSLQPGEYRPLVTFTDEAGQVLKVELPRIVKVGEPRYPADYGRVGVNLGDVYNNGIGLQLIYELQEANPNSVIRFFIHPTVIWPNRNRTDLNFYGDYIRSANHPIIIIGGQPSWLGDPSGDLSSQNINQMARLVYNLLQKFPDVKIIEAANEPDYYYQMSPKGFVNLQKAVFLGAMYNNPRNIVLMTWAIDQSYLRQIVENGACNYANATSLHKFPLSPWDEGDISASIQEVRTAMTNHRNLVSPQCDETLFLLTETGGDVKWRYDEGSPLMRSQPALYYTRLLNSNLDTNLISLETGWEDRSFHWPLYIEALRNSR